MEPNNQPKNLQKIKERTTLNKCARVLQKMHSREKIIHLEHKNAKYMVLVGLITCIKKLCV